MRWLLPLILAAACPFPPLPDSLLKLVPSFEVTSAANTFGRFLLPSNSTRWAFTISQEALFRFSLDPVNVNIECSLRSKAKLISKRTVSVDGHALITTRLKAGSYALTLNAQAELNEDQSTDTLNTDDCLLPYVYLSLAIAPLTQLEKLSKTDLKAYRTSFPNFDLSESLQELTPFRQLDSMRYIDISSVPTDTLSVLSSYVLELREMSEDERTEGHSGIWDLTMSVHHEFVEFGGVLLLLDKQESAAPTSLQCVYSGACTISHRTEKNSVILSTQLTPGNYTLWALYLGLSDIEKTTLKQYQGGYLPFSVFFRLSPLPEREDRFNCEAGRLPVSMNAPGLMDKQGFLSYHDEVYADLYATKQQSHLTLAQASILRLVTIEPSGVGIDIQIIGPKGDTVALSATVGGTEGILVELEAGGYTVQFVFEQTMVKDPRHLFCETFRVELDVMPQKAASAYINLHDLDSCQDDSSALAAILDKQFAQLKDSKGSFLLNPVPGTSYRLPLKSIAKGDEVLFSYDFSLSVSSYIYFEVLSHPVLADLTLVLQRKLDTEEAEDVFGDMQDTLSLDRFSRRTFHGQVNSGSYVLILKTGPGAKNKGKSKIQISDSNFKTLSKCVVFQVKAEVLPMSENKFKQWSCGGVGFSLAPNTLNTVDKLGLKGENQAVFPETSLFLQDILAPDNHKSKEPEGFNIFVDKESIFRVNFASEYGGMIAVLKTGTKEIARVGSKNQNSGILFLTATLQQHQSYSLSMYFYPSEATGGCPVYDMNLEIRAIEGIESVRSQQTCKEVIPASGNLVRYRTIDSLSPQFDMSSGEYSSSLHDSDFRYYHGSEVVRFSVPFDIQAQAAVVTAHLQFSFVETGLRFFIEDDEDGATVENGMFESSHRMEAHAVVLPKGKYNFVIEETGSGPSGLCNEFSAAVLVEDEDQWGSYDDLIKKTNGCGFPAMPKSLNLIGELEEGELHWHRELPLDADNMGHRMTFTLQEPSIVHLVSEKVPDITFFARFFKADQKPYTLLFSRDAVKGVHARIEPGSYILELVYSSDSDVPHPSECATHWIDFQIVPESLYNQLAESNSCDQSSTLPGALNMKKPGEGKYLVYTGEPYSAKTKVDLSKDAEVLFELTYEGALTGPMRLSLYDNQGSLVQTSVGVQDYSTLSAALPAATYLLQIDSTMQGKELPPVCSKITLFYSAEETTLPETLCEGTTLPEKLYSEETKPFGGPQAKDGSLTFYGVFKVPEGRSVESTMLRIGEPSIVRILHIVNSPGATIESTLYQDAKLTLPLGYSKTAGRAGSFILELPARHEPYVFSLTFLKQRKSDVCLSFELAIEIELKESVMSKLKCQSEGNDKSLLPELQVNLSGKETKGGLNYAIKGDWLIGNPRDFPRGITSKGTKNGTFVYEMQVDIRTPGRFSAYVEFDFLTNDLYLQLLKGQKAVGKSTWQIQGENLHDGLELASSIEDVQVEAGKYTLVLRQAVAANHLTQMFSEVDLCFPFSFAVEFAGETDLDTPENETNVNKLVSVIPSDKRNFNPSQGLSITITWEEPVHKGKNGSYVKAFYLENDKKVKIHPSSVRQEKSKPQKLELTFKQGLLAAGSCYSLKMTGLDFDLAEDDPQPEFDFAGAHEYCTGVCSCNPKSKAKCNDSMECVCPSPYAGITCDECVSGYSFDSTTSLCFKDECANCAGQCVNGKCEEVPACDCGDYGTCNSKGKCKCKEAYTGEKCTVCEDEDRTFPDCYDCKYDQLPTNITYVEGRNKGKASINRKGEFSLSLDRVEKRLQAVGFRLQKTSQVQVEVSGSLQNTKIYLVDSLKKPYKALSDESDNGVRTLEWKLTPGKAYVLAIKSEAEYHCDVLAVNMDIIPTEEEVSEGPKKRTDTKITEPEVEPDQCQGHGQYRDGKCECDVGYVGSSCGKCDEGYTPRANGVCSQQLAPAITTPVDTQESGKVWLPPTTEETSWSTTLVGLGVFALAFAALYYLYKTKNQGGVHWRRIPANPTGFDMPDDEEEERMGLQPGR